MSDAKRPVNVIDAKIDLDRDTLVLTFPTLNKGLTVKPEDMNREIVRMATLHGLKQKLVDAAAIKRNEDTGLPASAEDKYQAVYTVWERLMSGHWNKQPGEASQSGDGYLYRALCRLYEGKATPEAIRERVKAMDKKEQAALRKNAKIAAVIDEIKAEEAKDVSEDASADALEALEDALGL